jgi:hypothetical protein
MDSYKECACYIPELDSCCLPGYGGRRYIKCWCKKGSPDEFCVGLSNFLKSKPKDLDVETLKELDKYMVYISYERSSLLDMLNSLMV